MENLLNRAYFRQHCHECGHSYALTLYGVLQEQRIRREWLNHQNREVSDPDTRHIIDTIPEEALEELEAAWERVASASEAAGLSLLISPPSDEELPHQH